MEKRERINWFVLVLRMRIKTNNIGLKNEQEENPAQNVGFSDQTEEKAPRNQSESSGGEDGKPDP